MSVIRRVADSNRTSPQVRKVPLATDIDQNWDIEVFAASPRCGVGGQWVRNRSKAEFKSVSDLSRAVRVSESHCLSASSRACAVPNILSTSAGCGPPRPALDLTMF